MTSISDIPYASSIRVPAAASYPFLMDYYLRQVASCYPDDSLVGLSVAQLRKKVIKPGQPLDKGQS